MARRGTWLVVGALAAIALVAAVDALRGDGAAEPGPAPGTTSEATTTEAAPAAEEPQPAVEAFGGVLYYTDESCELRAVRLPTLDPAEAPNWDDCRFVLSPDGTRVSGAGSAWDPHSDPRIGRLFQSEGGSIQVSSNLGPEGEPIRGTAPAWRPSGRLTYVAGGELREWPGGETVLSQSDLAVTVRAHPDVPDSGRVREVALDEAAWLDDDRLAAVLSVPVENAVEHVVAVFEGRRPAWVDFAGPQALFDLRVSPRGRFFALMEGSTDVMFDSRRGRVQTPAVLGPELHALTWSPDEQWAAAAADTRVYVFRPGEPQLRVRELPITASDLAWRGTAEPPPLTGAVEARAWLGGVRATGRLFVTEPGCRLRALRLPDLRWEDEPDGEPAPCRFALDAVDRAVAEAISVAPGGQLRATCRDGRLAVFGPQGRTADIADACAPAWMPDGTLTFILGGELWRGTREIRRIVTRAELRDMFGRDAALEEVAWLDDRRIWAVVRVGSSDAVAFMTVSGLVFSPTFTAPRIEGLEVSATGMVAARTDSGIVFFDSGGRRALSFPGAKAVTWAPGNLVAAVATPRQILLVAPVSREVVPLPLAVEDLEWVVP
jgi:hypothetical protein